MPFTIGPKPHNKIPDHLRELIEKFFSLMDWKGLYLTGGTCLAEYYFGHRISVDIDLFTQEEGLFREAERSFVDRRIFSSRSVEGGRKSPHFAQFFLKKDDKRGEPVKIDMVLDVVPRLDDPLRVGNVWVDSLDDILANKVGCLISRNDAKDYLDLYRLIPASHMTARELVEHGKKKEGGLDPVLVANQMEFLFDLPSPVAEMGSDADWEEVKMFFRKFQKELLDLIKPPS